MARRSAARVRADSVRPGDEPVPRFLSARGRACLARLEHTRLWPGAAAEALDALARFVRDPVHRIWDPRSGCGVPQCCPDLIEVRRVLELVAHNLPSADARLFRARVAALDELW